ncbi:MAG: FAD-dependent oxidoreductase [Candidatus Omnitrophica bacterium]|nr:FAD-dependent oxidoreductase [Candidatus Omnitrophota bacterium]
MTPRAIVIGGGLAGLAAGVALADAGWRVTVLERGGALGGRARSFTDPASGDVVDNGQHVFLGAYTQTLRFLKRLGTDHLIRFQPQLTVAFAEAGRRPAVLRCPSWPAPWSLAAGLCGFGALSWGDKLAMLRVVRHLRTGTVPSSTGDSPCSADDHLDQMTVAQWLATLGQTPRSRQVFWDPLTIAALNDDPEHTSALGLATVLARMFGQGSSAARLGLATVGLSDLYTRPAARIIEQAGGTVRVNTAVAAADGDGARATGLRLAGGERLTADAYVIATPPHELARLLPSSLTSRDPTLAGLSRFTASPIVSINLWLDRLITDQTFVGLIGRRVQWVFNRSQVVTAGPSTHVALVISAAAAYVGQSNEPLVALAREDLEACLPAARGARWLKTQIVREHAATIRTPPGSQAWRPGPRTPWPNLSLAGDWTATGLPATIESAVASGAAAALQIACTSNPAALA